MESTLSSPCSRSDLPFAHFDFPPSHDLVLWTDGSVPFPFGKGGSGVLANCSLCGTEATLSFSAGPVVQVSLLKPAPFRKLFAGFGRTYKSAISLLFSFYLTFALSSPPYPLFHAFFYFKLCERSGKNCLLSPPALSGYNGSPNIRFSRVIPRLMSWPGGERYLHSLQFLVVSFLLSLVSTLLFSLTEAVLSNRNSSTLRFPRFLLRNLCSLVTLAVFSLVYAATDKASC